MPAPISCFCRTGILGNLALDRQGTVVADLLERAEEPLHAHVALAQGHLDAPLLAGTGGPLAVLAVYAPHVAADLLQGIDRIAGTVENHVRRIEVHEQVVAAGVGQEFQERVGRLLAGFQMHPLALRPAVAAQIAGHGNYLPVDRIRRP